MRRLIVSFALVVLAPQLFAQIRINSTGMKVAVDPTDGSIYVGGFAFADDFSDPNVIKNDFASYLAGFDSKGRLQDNFGMAGVLRIEDDGDWTGGRTLAAENGVVQGGGLVNITENRETKKVFKFYRVSHGKFDESFGKNGQITFPTSSNSPVLVEVRKPGLPSFAIFRDWDAEDSSLPMQVSNDGTFTSLSNTFPSTEGKFMDAFAGDDQGRSLAAWVALRDGSCKLDISVDRLNPDGSLDTAFGAQGHMNLKTPFEGRASITQMLAMPNGNFLVAFMEGKYQQAEGEYESGCYFQMNSILQMYNEQGELLKESPLVNHGIGSAFYEKAVLTLGSDGYIYYNADFQFMGKELRRFTQDLVPDETYTTTPANDELTGFWHLYPDSATFAMDSKSRIYVVGSKMNNDGSGDYSAALARIGVDGQYDRTFGENGVVTINFPESFFQIKERPRPPEQRTEPKNMSFMKFKSRH